MPANRGPAFIGKVAILVLGVLILGLGLHSHFKSNWNAKFVVDNKGTVERNYEACKDPSIKQLTKQAGISCPSISLEKYFVAMILITFILSLLGFAAGFILDLESSPMKLADAGYHGVAAFLLLIAGIVYIVSANQIDDLIDVVQHFNPYITSKGFLHGEKLAAGSLTIIQCLVYGVVAFFIIRT